MLFKSVTLVTLPFIPAMACGKTYIQSPLPRLDGSIPPSRIGPPKAGVMSCRARSPAAMRSAIRGPRNKTHILAPPYLGNVLPGQPFPPAFASHIDVG